MKNTNERTTAELRQAVSNFSHLAIGSHNGRWVIAWNTSGKWVAGVVRHETERAALIAALGM